MKVYFDYKNFDVQRPAITTGVFDGVHLGHQGILKRLNDAAKAIQGESVVVTFWPHPRLVLRQDQSIKLLNTLEEKLKLLENNGVQHVVIIPFTEEFSKNTSSQFVEDIIVNSLHVRHFIIGYNHHFGKGREGNFDAMLEFSKKYGFVVDRLEMQTVHDKKISSSIIRNYLNEGDVSSANNCFGYDYMISGRVVEGQKLGRSIGFPTANIHVEQDFKLIPKEGVYAVFVDIDGMRYPGMLNIGYRPTVDLYSRRITIEVHLLNYNGDLYQKDITLYFRQRIRDEIKFSGLEQLQQQLLIDKAEIAKILGV